MENEVLDDGMQHDHLHVTAESKMYLQETAKWAKFLAILGFIFAIIISIAGFFMGSFMDNGMSDLEELARPEAARNIRIIMTVAYVLIGLLYIIPSYYLFKFSTTTKEAIQSNNSLKMEIAFQHHKAVYKFMGIFMIVILGFYAIALLAVIAGAAFM